MTKKNKKNQKKNEIQEKIQDSESQNTSQYSHEDQEEIQNDKLRQNNSDSQNNNSDQSEYSDEGEIEEHEYLSLDNDKKIQNELLIKSYQEQIDKINKNLKTFSKLTYLKPHHREDFQRIVGQKLMIQEQLNNLQDQPTSKWCWIIAILFFVLIFFSKFQEEFYQRFTQQEENYYEILNINQNASIQDIKKVYRTLIKEYHPDKNKNCLDCEKKFVQIQKAYEILSNKEQRQIYDQTNGLTNFIESSSLEINQFNYDDLVVNSYDIWFIQPYKNDEHFCETFAPFWEEIYPQYPFLNFGRINLLINKRMISRLPFGIKGFPFVYYQEKNMEPEFADIVFRGRSLIRDLKEFIFSHIKQELKYQDFQKDQISNEKILFLGINQKKIPQIKLHFFIRKIEQGLGIKVYLSDNLNSEFYYYENQQQIIYQKFQQNRNCLEKITDFIGNITQQDLNKKSYSLLCKNKNNQCLIILKNQKLNDLIQDQEEKLKEKLYNDYEYRNDDFIQPLYLNLENQPKMLRILKNIFKEDLNLKGQGFLINNELGKVQQVDLFDDIIFKNSESQFIKNYFGEDLFTILRVQEFNFINETLNVWKDTFINFWFISGLIIFLIFAVKKYNYKFWNIFTLFLILTFSYSFKIMIDSCY